jgi:hypothetical protein
MIAIPQSTPLSYIWISIMDNPNLQAPNMHQDFTLKSHSTFARASKGGAAWPTLKSTSWSLSPCNHSTGVFTTCNTGQPHCHMHIRNQPVHNIVTQPHTRSHRAHTSLHITQEVKVLLICADKIKCWDMGYSGEASIQGFPIQQNTLTLEEACN